MAKNVVWILQTGEPLPIDENSPRPMRSMNIAHELVRKNYKVIIWASNFDHTQKKFRKKNSCSNKKLIQNIVYNKNYEINLLNSPGYKKNISLKRFYDHIILAKNLNFLLDNDIPKPDFAILGFPPIEINYVMAKWLNKNNIPFFIDVKDLWPEMFYEYLPKYPKFLISFLFSPYIYLTKKLFKNAKVITAPSKSIVKWVNDFSQRKSSYLDKILPLTVKVDKLTNNDLNKANKWWDRQGIIDKKVFRIIFIGSHQKVYDFKPLIECNRKLKDENIYVEFIICGSGEKTSSLKKMFRDEKNIFFPGWIDKPKILSLASRSSISIAPYVNLNNFIWNIPNKIIDSLSMSLPIVSPLKGEVHELIRLYRIGKSYTQGDGKSLFRAIKFFYDSNTNLYEYANNCKTTYESMFKYEDIYENIPQYLEYIRDELEKSN